MLAQELVSNTIVSLKTSDTGMLALSLMEEHKTTHLPIVNGGVFIGLICEEDIYSYNHFEEAIGAHPILNSSISAQKEKHIYDVLNIVHENKLSLLPVVDENDNYQGSILVSELVINLAEITGITNPGGIIVLEMNIHDYSLSEIAQIVESNNNNKIINSFVNNFADSTRIEVTIKVNTTNIEGILQAFMRYDYQIKASYSEVDLNDNMTDRYNSLMNYLNI